MLKGGRSYCEFEIYIWGLDSYRLAYERLIFSVVVYWTVSKLLYNTTGNNVVDAVAFHKGKAQLLKGRIAVEADDGVDVEDEKQGAD